MKTVKVKSRWKRIWKSMKNNAYDLTSRNARRKFDEEVYDNIDTITNQIYHSICNQIKEELR